SAASLAELCAEDGIDSAALPQEIAGFGVQVLDIPAQAAVKCGEAYREYRAKRKRHSGKVAPKMPLPDFFIGAHADLLGLEVLTNDVERYQTYFPNLTLDTP